MILNPLRLPLAREYLRQMLAIAAGVDPMSGFSLDEENSKQLKDAEQPAERADRLAYLATFRERAAGQIAGAIGGSRLTVWRDNGQGGFAPAPSVWAAKIFDAEGAPADQLYVDHDIWGNWAANFAIAAEARLGRPLSVERADKLQPRKVDRPPVAQAGQWWIIHQAVAWLALGDMSLATAIPGDIAAMQAQGKDGHVLAWLALSDRVDDSASLPHLKERLRAACEAGKVAAIGVRPGEERASEPIRSAEFVGVDMWHGKELSIHRTVAGQASPAGWLDVRFSEQGVIALSRQVVPKHRRRQFDEEAFIAQALEELKDEGGYGAAFGPGNLHDRMEKWCGERWPKTPSRTWIYGQLPEAVRRYEEYVSGLA